MVQSLAMIPGVSGIPGIPGISKLSGLSRLPLRRATNGSSSRISGRRSHSSVIVIPRITSAIITAIHWTRSSLGGSTTRNGPVTRVDRAFESAIVVRRRSAIMSTVRRRTVVRLSVRGTRPGRLRVRPDGQCVGGSAHGWALTRRRSVIRSRRYGRGMARWSGSTPSRCVAASLLLRWC